jgi:hypothetical protein
MSRPGPAPGSGIEVGSRLLIPCRICGKEMLSFFVNEGSTLLRCQESDRMTEVLVTRVEGILRIKTRGQS